MRDTRRLTAVSGFQIKTHSRALLVSSRTSKTCEVPFYTRVSTLTQQNAKFSLADSWV